MDHPGARMHHKYAAVILFLICSNLKFLSMTLFQRESDSLGNSHDHLPTVKMFRH